MKKTTLAWIILFGALAIFCLLFSGYLQYEQCINSLAGSIQGCSYSPIWLIVSVIAAIFTVMLIITGILEKP